MDLNNREGNLSEKVNVGASASKRASLRRFLGWVMLGYGVVTVSALTGLLYYLRAETIELQGNQLAAYAQLAQVHTQEVFQEVEKSLRLAETRLAAATAAGSASEELISATLREIRSDRPGLRVFMLDERGRVVYSPGAAQIGNDASDRQYFIRQRENPSPALEIGAPIRSRAIDGAWLMPMTLALRRADGKFGGVVGVGLEPQYFSRAWAFTQKIPDLCIALSLTDGQLLARIPFVQKMMDMSLDDRLIFSQAIGGQVSGIVRIRSPSDGLERLVAFQRVGDHPNLLAHVGLPMPAVLAPWWRLVWIIVSGWAIATMALGGLMTWLAREWNARRALNDRYRVLFKASPYASAVTDFETQRVLAVNEAAVAQYGWSHEEFLSLTANDIVLQEDLPAMSAKRQALSSDATQIIEGLRHRKKDGTVINVEIAAQIIEFEGRRAVLSIISDVTAKMRAAATEKRLRHFVDIVRDTMIDGLIVIDMVGSIQVFNRAAERIFGYSADEVIGQNLKMLMTNPTRDAHDGYLQSYKATGKRSVIGVAREVTARRKDGATLPITIAVGEAKFEDETIFVGIIHDLTAQKAVEEGELRQSQRLDAIGKLTGGIAHDFNNLLLVIMTAVEALIEEAAASPKMRKQLDRIDIATQRAADLTRQLLAFARKQPLEPRPTSLNDVVVATGKLLGRALGENIEIDSILADDLWTTSIDRAQLESALVNLAINARDAMPEGGRLMVETRNAVLDEDYVQHNPEAVVGEYAMLTVSDTGQGIPPAVLERVFEPFFTTKETGKGTGLGLSMVYGFIKQSNGHIKIYSEMDHGTTVRIYLPRSDASPTAVEDVKKEIIQRGTERILVVEDDDAVRESVVSRLLSLGYVIEEARNGAEGLDRVTRDGPYDLLLTDVIMPGLLNGRALADAARRHQASLRVLFMSGYTENAIVHHGRLDPGARLLNKPFRKIDLARAVRSALDSAEEGGAV